MLEIIPTTIVCAGCGKSSAVKSTPKGVPRTPAGWKRRGEETYCLDCWRNRYVLRTISMSVASPLDCRWDELRKVLRLVWGQTTAASNWMMTELYARDVRRGSQEKMPPMERVYLYPEARRRFPALPSQTVASLERAVQRKYSSARYAVIWTGSASLPTHRYPTPFPVPSKAWHGTIEGDRAIVSVRIGDARMRLRLKRGPQFRRQMAAFKQIVRGEAVSGELALYDRAGLMCKMAVWLPRAVSESEGSNTLTVRTRKDCLLVAVNVKDKALWRYNGDQLRRWAAEHRAQLQRWSEDQKYEARPVPAFAARREAAARKYRNRLNSATHEIAAHVAAYAARHHFAAVRYDDADHSYLGDGFPWYRLRALLAENLDARGITLKAIGPSGLETPEPLAVE